MTIRLAVDAMGGDIGIDVVIPAANLFIENNDQDVRLTFFGDASKISQKLLLYPKLTPFSDVVHTDDVIANDMKPSSAVRHGRKSSMALAIESVAHDLNHAVISAGNTGAYMALSKIYLKTFTGIDRPAIPARMPSASGQVLVLDVGANVDCTPALLSQFAKMGNVYAQYILGVKNPKVGLLNIGSEEQKGDAILQDAYALIKTLPLNFVGFVEGDDIARGDVDVVVTDGFTGNVVLKTIEGTAKLFSTMLKNSLKKSWRGPISYMIGKPAFDYVRKVADPRLYNGAVFLGLRKIAVKSHGGTDIVGFANALKVSVDMVQKKLPYHIEQTLS
jgi:phosphate acyltransferase